MHKSSKGDKIRFPSKRDRLNLQCPRSIRDNRSPPAILCSDDSVMSKDVLTLTQDCNTLEGSNDSALARSSGTNVGSPFSNRTRSFSDGEEKYECYGEADDLDGHVNDPGNHLNLGQDPKQYLSSDSFRSSSSGSIGSGRIQPSPNSGFQQRSTWLRTSLRRASGSSKRVSSNALASQLFRSGTPNGNDQSSNHSRRSSTSCDFDDTSLEEDVLDLNDKVQILQQQVTDLTENQTNNDDRYSKVKQENSTLMSRIHSLEEQIKELELRSEDRVKDEEARMKELMARLERDKAAEIEQYTNRLYSLQQEHLGLKEDVIKLKNHVDRLKQEKSAVQEELAESTSQLISLREEHQKLLERTRREREEINEEKKVNSQLLQQYNIELDELRRFKQENTKQPQTSILLELPVQYQELEEDMRKLKEENKYLLESNEELQAQILNSRLEQGRTLIHQGQESLAVEFDNLSKDQVMEALQEQKEVNTKLRRYIDGILLNVLEHYPQLLEVKPSNSY
ncbi:rab11 family-interacting protein 4A-like isoform X2 [Limulus polyphemus]|uniref:Rab11 family-interacting protein 4A-like isoform X2 n=1 Tax=Limulus polyphemus TaxID=6850 RepID=A0ABM1B8P5_LIMPO|nr:rab11 family-interacting protein 4A-like isoform X2 [Limulus polyphemus]